MPDYFKNFSLKQMAEFHLEPFCFERKVSFISRNEFASLSASLDDAYTVVNDLMVMLSAEWGQKKKQQLRKFVTEMDGIVFAFVDADESNRQTIFSSLDWCPDTKLCPGDLPDPLEGKVIITQTDELVDRFISEQNANLALKHKRKIVDCIYRPFLAIPDDFDCDDAAVWHAIEVLRTQNPWETTMQEFPRLIELGKKVQEAISAHFHHIAETEGLVAFEAKRAAMVKNE